MKISTREVVLLTILFLMLVSGAYYMFFYTPNTKVVNELQESINSKTTQIDNASIMLLQRQALAIQKDALEEEFTDVAKNLHENFSDASILRLIERTITPYTNTMNIEFGNKTTGTTEKAGVTYMRTVQVSLHTTYDNLQGIIKAFEEGDAANRIVDFSCSGGYNESSRTAGQEMSVSFSIDFLVR